MTSVSMLRLDAVTEEVSLYHQGASVHVRDGYSDGHLEITVKGCAKYIVSEDMAATQPVANWPTTTIGGASIPQSEWNPVEVRG